MENNYPATGNGPKTTETNGAETNPNGSGESTVQQGDDIVNGQEQNIITNDEMTNEEYISDYNSETKEANGNNQLKQSFTLLDEDEDDDDEDDDDEDDDDDDDDGLTIGDDPADTKKKIPVM